MEHEETVDETIDSSGDETIEETQETLDTEDVETLKVELEKERKARQQLTARAKRAEEALKKAPKFDSPKLETKVEGATLDEALDLRLDGYSKDEVSFILKNGGRKALEDNNSFVNIAVKTRREQAKAEDEISKAKDTAGISTFEKKYPADKLAKMSAEEMAKILPHTEE